MVTSNNNAPLVLIEQLRLKVSLEEYAAVVRAAVARLEREGIKEFTFMQQYASAGSDEVSVVLVFSDPSAISRHTKMIETWSEFRAMLPMIEVLEVRVLGEMTAELAKWFSQFGSKSMVFDMNVAGFVREQWYQPVSGVC